MKHILAHISSANFTQSELARLAGVSRQAVSKWFKDGNAGLRLSTLQQLSSKLGVPLDFFVRPFRYDSSKAASLADAIEHLSAQFLWDGLYPSVEAFAAAIASGQDRAIARLVQEAGLFQAKKIAGAQAFKKYPQYMHYLKPERKRELDLIWQMKTQKH